jgi:hypothetical protein
VLAGGGRVSLLDGMPLRFNRSERLQPVGMLAGGAALHARLIPLVTPLTSPTE